MFRLVAVATVLAISLLLALSTLAYANAIGTEPVGGFDYIFEGASISILRGSPLARCIARSLWRRIDYQYEDHSDEARDTNRGPVSDMRQVKSHRTLPSYGRACALLLDNGTERDRQCHPIGKPS